MLKRAIGVFVVSAMALPSLAAALPVSGAPTNPADFLDVRAGHVIPGAYIVLLKEYPSGDVEAVLARHRIAHNAAFQRIKGFSANLDARQLELLKSDPDVQLVEPDVLVTAFAQPRQQFDWSKYFPKLRSSASSSAMPISSSRSSAPPSAPSSVAASSAPSVALPTGINRIDAEVSPLAAINGGGNDLDVDVAVIDSGVEKHGDLNVFKQVEFLSTSTNVSDENGHGTHVAGTVGAKDNGSGVVGVAPGARIWSVRVLDRNGSGPMSGIVAGVNYVADNASSIEVANLSLGCECASAALDEALNRAVNAGVVVVVAAGNSNKDASTFAPANNDNVIAVSAVADFNGLPGGGAASTCRSDVDDTRADFSNYGADVDIAAPGVCINSTAKGGGYALMSGTSMASPHVAGAAALYVLKNGKPTDGNGVAGVRNGLIEAAAAQDDGFGFSGDVDSHKERMLRVSAF
jgi:subtilisin